MTTVKRRKARKPRAAKRPATVPGGRYGRDQIQLMQMVTISVRVRREQLEGLAKLAVDRSKDWYSKREGYSGEVRRAIDEYLTRQTAPKQAGKRAK